MQTIISKKIFILLLFLSPLFSLAIHAQTEDKVVTIDGDATYSGTYVYQGTRSSSNGSGGVKVRAYYKHSSGYYLYADYVKDLGGPFPNDFAWAIDDAIVSPISDYVYEGWNNSNMDYPLSTSDGWWWGHIINGEKTITITNAVSGVAPTVSTNEASLVTTTSGTLNGNIIADGGATTNRGFVYSSTDNTPTLAEVNGTTVFQITKGTGTGTYSESVGSLTSGQTYYYQAYGSNTYGDTHGGVKSFTTPTTSQPNKYLSGVTTPAAANGVYVWIGNYYGKPAWKHQSQNYWIYYSFYTPVEPFNTQYNWYIDDELKDNHGSNDFLFDHADAASCPSSGWATETGTGTPSIIDYPNISFTDGSSYSPGNPTAGTTNNPIGQFKLSGELAGASLTAATITVTGTRTNVSNLKIWSSTDATFNSGSDTQLNSQSDGATVTFSGFNSAIATSGTYYFITADLASNSSGTIALTIGSQANLTISGGAIASGFANAALSSGTITITPLVEIDIKGNNVSIGDGDTTPALADHTDFGSVAAASGTVIRTFTIYNSGGDNLTISSVQVSGTNLSDFTVTTSPNSPVAPSGNTTFQVTFDPSGRGLRTATITVNNNDSDEGAYDFAIQGTGSNTAPTVTGLATDITTTEDAASNVNLSAASFSDADGDALIVTLTASAGVFTASTGGSVTIGGSGTGTLTLSGTIANINTFLDTESNIKYTGASNVNGNDAATFTVNANDGTVNPLLGTVNIDISAVNDDPTITNLPSDITVLEDVESNVNLSVATFADVDAASGTVTFTLAVGSGTLTAADAGGVTVSGSGTATLTLLGTVSNIDAYLNTASNIKYIGTLNTNGDNVTTLTLSANDGGNTGSGGGGNVGLGTVNIDITAVNDEPSFTIGANRTVAQNAGAQSINNFITNINDGDAEVTQNVSFNISNNNNSLFASQPTINSAGTLTYTPDATKFGKAIVTVSISDDGGTANGGDNQSPDQTFKIFITPLGVTINELNSTPTTEEFVELYNNSSSISMNGLVLVFFNGGDDKTYKTSVDLDGYTLAANDFFVVSDAGVTNSDLTWSATDIQDGPDAVALFVGEQSDFTVTPSTPVTSDGLVDAIVYGSSDDADLRTALGGVSLYNENAHGKDDTESISRVPDGTGSFTTQTNTPGITNDLSIRISSATYNYNTNQLVVSGNYFVGNAGSDNDVDVSMLTLKGEGGNTYTLSSTSDVDISSATQFSVTLSGIDVQNVEALLNKDGMQAADNTTNYNLAAADNWLPGAPPADDIADATNGITVSNYANPAITSATYDVSTGVLVATGTNFVVKSGAANDIDASLFTFTGQGGSTYSLTNTNDVEIASATQFTLTLSAADKSGVTTLLNKNGTQSVGGTVYNLGAADNWMTGSPVANNLVDATTPITVSNVPIPTIVSATYNNNTNILVVTCTDLLANTGGTNDVDISKLTITGEGGGTYTITSATDVEITSSTEFSVPLSGIDLTNIEALLNKDGTSSAGTTTYNLAAAEDWLTGFDPAENIADLTGNGITVSNYANPVINSATYNATTGVLVVTGTNFINKSGAANDIDASFLTITGEGGNTYQLTNTPDVDITSATSFTLTLSSTDKINVDGLLNKAGTSSADVTTYNLSCADNWSTGAYSNYNIEDLTGNGITVSNIQTPTITSATYDSDTGIFVVTGTNLFKKPGTANDIDVSKLTVTGQSGDYTISDVTADVEITSSTEFTFTVTGTDKTQVDARLDLFGTQSSGGTTYNLAAAEDWLTAADPSANIADLTNNGITVVVNPKITSATYNAATGVIIVTGTNIQANAGGADIDASKFSITGEGEEEEAYTLTNTPDVERTSATQFTLTLSATDWNAVAMILNKNGTTSTSGTVYNIGAADDWCTNVTAGNTADLTNNGVTAGNVPVPAITSATYNASTGVFVVTGAGLVKKSGVLNDIDISKLTITGEGGDTYTITNTIDVEITSGTQFTLTLDATDKNAVNMILNKNGTSSTSGTTYNLAAAEDWATGADAAVNVVDATGNGITASNVSVPVITSATYHWSNGMLTATGTGFVKKSGATNDIDASKFTFKGECGSTYTLVGSPDVEITSTTEFSITLDATDKAAVNLLLNKAGIASNDNTTYNLSAAEDWATGADAAVVIADLITPITAGNFNTPPTGANDVISTNEDVSHTFAASDFTFNDVDGDHFAGIQIQTIETAGDLKYNGTDVTNGLDCPDITKLIFASAANMSGSPYATFTYKIYDDRGGLSVSPYTMTINVISVDDAPVLTGMESDTKNYKEGSSPINITNSIAIDDIDNADIKNATIKITGNYISGQDVLSFSNQNGITGVWSEGTMTLSGVSSIANYESAMRSITYKNTSANPDTADRTISFTVNDGELNSNTVTRKITINSTNNAPVLSVIENQTTKEDVPLIIELSASDAEGDSLIYTASSNKSDVSVSITGTKLLLTPALNWNGEAIITVMVSDGKAQDTTSFNLTVLSINDAPIISSLQNVQMNEDEIKEIIIEASDVEGDSLIYSASSDKNNVSVSIDGTKLLLSPALNWNGEAIITIMVSDGKAQDTTSFNLTVLSINDAPIIGPLQNVQMDEDGIKEIIIEASDVEGDSLRYVAISNDIGVGVNMNGNKLIITPTKNWTGTTNITISVTDGFLTTSSSFTLEVLKTNDAPVLTGIETNSLKYLVRNSEIQITNSLQINDQDDSNLEGAEISISNNYRIGEDVLTFTNQNGITGNWNNENGILSLMGSASVGNYEKAIQSIKYSNSSNTSSSSTRTISIKVNDDESMSETVIREIIISILLSPSNITAAISNPLGVVINWEDSNSNEDGFIVERKKMGDDDYIIIDSLKANSITFVDKKIVEACCYSYRLSAYNLLGAKSDAASCMIPIPVQAPSELKATANEEGNISLIWVDNSNVEDGYVVEKSVGTLDNFVQIKITGKDSINYVDNNIKDGEKYFYRIYAFKDSVKSEFSNVEEIIGIVTGITMENGIPTEFKLYQNYPNPFNPITTIKFDIPQEGKYSIKIYNILGQIVSVLAERDFSAGRYNVTFDASNLASGIYFYQLIGNKKNFIMKMLLIK